MLTSSYPITASTCLIFVLVLFGLTSSSATESATDGLGWIKESSATDLEQIPVVVFLEDDGLRRQVQRASTAGPLTRAGRIQTVTRRLQAFVPSRSAEIEQYLRKWSSVMVERFWIVPAYSATLTVEQIETLAAMPGISRVVPDEGITAIEPVETRSAPSMVTSSSGHLAMLNVPYLWDMGITGAGRVICSFDTGVEGTHPALAGSWRGVTESLHESWFSTITPDSPPTDKADHGTHTMGTMVGVDGSDTIGVAPGAQWIAAGVVDQGKSLQGTFSDILAAFEWALDPDGDPATTDDVPDVILNSWGVPPSLMGPCDETFFAAIDNVESAGIVCIFSAGNEGPEPSTLRNPACRAATPLNTFSVGAVDNGRTVATFSSRGPGGCDGTAIKPELVAPGVSIRSASKTGDYKLMSGTSMAAPFIAGLVALCRQYDPDATVDEIKTALIGACEDLGSEGEDNAYGYGFPDAARMLDFLSGPDAPRFNLADYHIPDDGIASPGETVDLTLTVIRSRGAVSQVTGELVTADVDAVRIMAQTSEFYFGLSGTISIGDHAFQIQIEPDIVNGTEVNLALLLRDGSGDLLDSLALVLPVGYAPSGTAASHESSTLDLTVSDFGQYGLAPGSIYNLDGQGFRYDNGDNLLYEAGLIVGRSALQLSSSVRGQDGSFRPSDLLPEIALSDEITGPDMAEHRTARMVDDGAEVSIPISINQITTDYGPAGDDGIMLVRYQLVNTSLSTLSGLYFGFLSDFDLAGGVEQLNHSVGNNLISQTGTSGPTVGLVGLSGLTGWQVVENASGKAGFDKAAQFEMIATPDGIVPDPAADYLTVISGGPLTLRPGDSVEVALALLVGIDTDEVAQRASRARELYLSPTSVDFPLTVLPDQFELHQNYPNPFNPSTTISFDLPHAEKVTLQVFNILGQEVRSLHSGPLRAGRHQFDWDGLTDRGHEVASGVYFYRLSSDDFSRSRKMMLLR